MPNLNEKKEIYLPSRYRSYWPWANPPMRAWTTDGPSLISDSFSRTRTSVNTPRFGSLRKADLPNQPFNYGTWKWMLPMCKARINFIYPNGTLAYNEYEVSPKYFNCEAAAYAGMYPGSDPNPTALARLIEQAKLNKGSLAVGIAEAEKTAAFVADSCRRLLSAFAGLKKGRLDIVSRELGFAFSPVVRRRFKKDFRSLKNGGALWRLDDGRMMREAKNRESMARRLEKFARAWWLEITYGWKPLLQDVQSQMQNLAEYLTEKSNRSRVVRSKAQTEEQYISYQDWGSYARTTTTARVVRKSKYVLQYHIPENPGVLTQFGLTDLALVAWEIIPFSFVADWFIPVGNYLEAINAYSGLEFEKGTLTESSSTYIESSLVAKPAFGYNPVQQFVAYSPIRATNTLFSVNRTVLTSFPTVQMPTFKDPRSFAHAASAIALISSIFRK